VGDHDDFAVNANQALDVGEKVFSIAADLQLVEYAEYKAQIERYAAGWSLDPIGASIGRRYARLKSEWKQAFESMIPPLMGVGQDIIAVAVELGATFDWIEQDAEYINPDGPARE
jgi:hypothetical protein